MNQKSIKSCIVFLFTALATKAVLAQGKKQNLRVCSHELPPYTYSNENGEALGLATEIIKLIANDLNWKLDISYSTWMRLRRESKFGHCDISYTVLKKQEYYNIFEYPKQELPNREAVFIVRKNSHIEYDGNLEKMMKAHSIGLYKDKVVNRQFELLKQKPWARIQEPVSSKSVLPMLIYHRFDAAIEDKMVAIHDLKAIGKLNEVKFLEPPLHITPAFFVFPKKGKAVHLIEHFDQAFASIKKSKAYKEIILRYNR